MVRWIVVVLLCLIISIRYVWEKNRTDFNVGDRVSIEATVTVEPRNSFGHQSVGLMGLIVAVPEGQFIYYGDRLATIGTVAEKVTSTGRRQLWLYPDAFTLTPGRDSLNSQIKSIRLLLVGKLKSYLTPPEAGLAAGMLFGGTEDLTLAQQNAFRSTGISHIVAASGYNVTLIVGWGVLILNKFLSRRWAIGLGMLICIFYVLLAGATAAVVRAGVMSILVSIGLISGRPTQAKWILFMTAACMLVWHPMYLEDIGFQLSIAATAGLVFFRPQGDWWTTIIAQFATMPIILHHFGNLSPIAPLVNILVLWMVPLVMQITALAVMIGLLINPLGQAVAYLSWPFLRLFNYLSGSFAKLTFSNVTVTPVSLLWVAGYYAVLLWVYFRWFRKHEA